MFRSGVRILKEASQPSRNNFPDRSGQAGTGSKETTGSERKYAISEKNNKKIKFVFMTNGLSVYTKCCKYMITNLCSEAYTATYVKPLFYAFVDRLIT